MLLGVVVADSSSHGFSDFAAALNLAFHDGRSAAAAAEMAC